MRSRFLLLGLFTGSLFQATASAQVCQPNLGFGGPGTSVLTVCGQPLTCGNTATISLTGARANAQGSLFFGSSQGATPFLGGILVPTPLVSELPFTTDGSGAVNIPIPSTATCGFTGSWYIQALYLDSTLPQGVGFSNAVRMNFFQGNDLHVGPNQVFGTIQSAIDSATVGKRVVVHTGQYLERLTWDKPVDIVEATGNVAYIAGFQPNQYYVRQTLWPANGSAEWVGIDVIHNVGVTGAFNLFQFDGTTGFNTINIKIKDCSIDDQPNGSQANTTVVTASGLNTRLELNNVDIKTDIPRYKSIVRANGSAITLKNCTVDARADNIIESVVNSTGFRGRVVVENCQIESNNSSGTILSANGGNITMHDSRVTASTGTTKLGDVRKSAGQDGTLWTIRSVLDAKLVSDVPIAISGDWSVLTLESSALLFHSTNLRAAGIDAGSGGRVSLLHSTLRDFRLSFGFTASSLLGPNSGSTLTLIALNNLFFMPGTATGVMRQGSGGGGTISYQVPAVSMVWTPSRTGTELLGGTKVTPNPFPSFQADGYHLAANLTPKAASVPTGSALDIDKFARPTQPMYGCDER